MKNKQLSFSLKKEDREILKKASAMLGISMGAFIRQSILLEAKKVLNDLEVKK